MGRLLRGALGPVAAAFITFYFGYHALVGDSGAVSLLEIERNYAHTKLELERAVAVRKRLEMRTRQLVHEPADADLYEEYVRDILNVGRPGEIVVPLGD